MLGSCLEIWPSEEQTLSLCSEPAATASEKLYQCSWVPMALCTASVTQAIDGLVFCVSANPRRCCHDRVPHRLLGPVRLLLHLGSHGRLVARLGLCGPW